MAMEKNNQPMRVALYGRVSKALDQNPENQLIPLRAWAIKACVVVEGEYVDEISSKDTRPEKETILKKLRLNEIDGVAVWKLDRWGRNMTELVMELEEFSKTGKSLICLQEGMDISTSAGRFMANILASMANFERDIIRERTLLGLARARAQGKKLGRPRNDGQAFKKPSRESVQKYAISGLHVREIAKILGTSRYWVSVVLLELKKEGSEIRVVQ